MQPPNTRTPHAHIHYTRLTHPRKCLTLEAAEEDEVEEIEVAADFEAVEAAVATEAVEEIEVEEDFEGVVELEEEEIWTYECSSKCYLSLYLHTLTFYLEG